MKALRHAVARAGRQTGIYLFAVGLAFVVLAALIAAMGYSVPRAFRYLLTTSFKLSFGSQETIKKTIPLIFTTYAFSIFFMIKFFNIGAWGQMMMGGTVAAAVGHNRTAAQTFGIPFTRTILMNFFIGGALAGLGGHPIGVQFAAFFMSVMLVGADSLQRTMRIPVELVFLAQGIIVLFIVTVREFLNAKRK